MYIMPKRGYRICLDCGTIGTSRMCKDDKYCPWCGSPTKKDSNEHSLTESQAKYLTELVGGFSHEFWITPEIIEKYQKAAKMCNIPEQVYRRYFN